MKKTLLTLTFLTFVPSMYAADEVRTTLMNTEPDGGKTISVKQWCFGHSYKTFLAPGDSQIIIPRLITTLIVSVFFNENTNTMTLNKDSNHRIYFDDIDKTLRAQEDVA